MILVLWLAVVFAYGVDQHRERYKTIRQLKQSQQITLDNLIQQKSETLQQLQSSLYFALATHEPHQREQAIKESWQLLSRQQPEAQLIYFSDMLKPLFQIGLFSATYVDSSHYIPQNFERTTTLLSSQEGKSFLSCKENCYINLLSASGHENSNIDGYILLRLPLHHILWNLWGNYQLHAAVLGESARYPFSDAWQTDEKKLFINNSTDPLLLEDLSNATLNNPLDLKKPNILHLKKKNQYWLINHFELSTGLWVCINLEISQLIQQQRINLYRIIAISLLVTLVTLALILYFLHKPIRLLQKIADTLPIIGKGDFEQARKTLDKLTTKEGSRDIVIMIDKLQSATIDMELLHNRLHSSIKEFSGKLSFIQELIDASNAMFLICDSENRIQLCNRYAADRLATEKSHLVGLNCLAAFHIEENPLNSEASSSSFITFQSPLKVDGKETLISWTLSTHQPQQHDALIYIYVGVDITERLRLEETIRHTADHDGLTELINRRRLNQILDKLIEDRKNFHLLYIDLNYFKVINDTLGHIAGDKLLVYFADILREALKDDGVAARTGGDEFTLITFLNHDDTAKLCKHLIDRCRSISLFGEEEKFLSARVGLSIGIVSFPDQATNSEELYSYADAAMYENKIDRVSSYHFYTGEESLVKKNKTHKYWNDLLDEALERKEVIPYFQGIHDAKTLNIQFFEVLCRIKNGEDLFSASQFLDVIAGKPMIARVDMYILEQAIKISQLTGYKQQLMVNISTYTLSLPHTTQAVLDILKSYAFPTERLIFEITEQASIYDFDKTINFMNKLRSFGIRFALDDFGTGYSSLSHLQRLPIQFLKIDKSFISDIKQGENNNQKNVEFMKHVINLAHAMGIEVIAEGVEYSWQAQLTQQCGAEYLQGYYLSMPQEQPSDNRAERTLA